MKTACPTCGETLDIDKGKASHPMTRELSKHWHGLSIDVYYAYYTENGAVVTDPLPDVLRAMADIVHGAPL